MWKTINGVFLIRAGLAFSFIYAGLGGFLKPENWIGWFPIAVREIVPLTDTALLAVWGIAEIALACWLLSGWKVQLAAYVAAFLLFAVTLANLASMDIVFRDIALGLVALGLALHAQKFSTVT